MVLMNIPCGKEIVTIENGKYRGIDSVRLTHLDGQVFLPVEHLRKIIIAIETVGG